MIVFNQYYIFQLLRNESVMYKHNDIKCWSVTKFDINISGLDLSYSYFNNFLL